MTALTDDTRSRSSGRLASGFGFALASATSFGLSGPLARALLDAGWSPAAAVAIRILLAAVVLAPAAYVQLNGRWELLGRNAATITVYGLVAVAGCQLAYFNAVAHMQVGVALLIEYTAPAAIVAWLWLRHGERPSRLTLTGTAVAAVGLLLVLDLVSGADVSVVGILWALGAMAGVAVFFVLSSRQDTGLPGSVLAFTGLLIGGAALLLAGTTGVVPLTWSTNRVAFEGFTTPWWVPVLLLGVVTAALAYVTGIAASRRLGSRLASFAALAEVLAALIFAWVLLGELPRGIQVAGGVLVLGGVVLVKLGESQTTRTTGTPGTTEKEPGLSVRPVSG